MKHDHVTLIGADIMPLKLVSVVIPCYKNAKTIARAIDSVLAQSYSAIEIIVVNDCSPESDVIDKVLSRYTSIVYICNISNLGVAATRNVGIAAAKGQFIALLDADDEYHTEKIAVQMSCINHGIALTCGVARVQYERKDKDSAFPLKKVTIVSGVNQIIYRNILNGAGLFIERDLILKFGGYDESLRSCEDYDLWIRLLEGGIKVKDVGQPLYFYYDNTAGLSKNFLNISKWEAEVIRRYADRQGVAWKRSLTGISVVSVWLIRQLMRYEIQPNQELRQQTLRNIDLLASSLLLRVTFRFIANGRVLYFPALLLRRLGSLRGL
tara:strand:- start:674 stop:1645 length:972 start_codon:yes stop_codon:yes gene_type:complete